METEATNDNSLTSARTAPADLPIELRIAGEDLLLSGRFEHWMPLVLTTNKEGAGSAQVLFDATSNRVTASPRPRRDRDLFTFKTTSVKSVGPQTYRLHGTLRSSGESRQVEALLQSPPAHTPFFVITFPVDRDVFADLWKTMETRNANAAAAGTDELRPQAWVKAPVLAAA